MYLKEIECENLDWFQACLTQDRVQWWAVLNLQVKYKGMGFLDYLRDYRLVKIILSGVIVGEVSA
jgi:hypothetical protein